VVIHCIRLKDNHTYRGVVDGISLMSAVCDFLELVSDELPKPSTLCKAFDRFKMWVWRQLLRASAQQLPTSGHGAIGGTYFERTSPSFHYRRRLNRSIQMVKATVLMGSITKTVLDI
jgi:hypothetical protein